MTAEARKGCAARRRAYQRGDWASVSAGVAANAVTWAVSVVGSSASVMRTGAAERVATGGGGTGVRRVTASLLGWNTINGRPLGERQDRAAGEEYSTSARPRWSACYRAPGGRLVHPRRTIQQRLGYMAALTPARGGELDACAGANWNPLYSPDVLCCEAAPLLRRLLCKRTPTHRTTASFRSLHGIGVFRALVALLHPLAPTFRPVEPGPTLKVPSDVTHGSSGAKTCLTRPMRPPEPSASAAPLPAPTRRGAAARRSAPSMAATSSPASPRNAATR